MSPLLLLAALALVLAAQAATKGRDSYTKIVTKCKQLHNVSEGEMERIKNKETDFCFSYNSKCLFACILKESHILTDGKFSKDNALIMSDVLHKDNAEDAEKARDVVDFCEKQKWEEVEPAYYSPCEHAYNIMICWAKEAKKRDIHSTDFFV